MNKLIEFSDGDDHFYLYEEEVIEGLQKAKLSLGSHLMDLSELRVVQAANEELVQQNIELRSQIDAVWALITNPNIHSWLIPTMLVAEALGGKLVKGMWER